MVSSKFKINKNIFQSWIAYDLFEEITKVFVEVTRDIGKIGCFYQEIL